MGRYFVRSIVYAVRPHRPQLQSAGGEHRGLVVYAVGRPNPTQQGREDWSSTPYVPDRPPAWSAYYSTTAPSLKGAPVWGAIYCSTLHLINGHSI
jgi:hypothetical protein